MAGKGRMTTTHGSLRLALGILASHGHHEPQIRDAGMGNSVQELSALDTSGRHLDLPEVQQASQKLRLHSQAMLPASRTRLAGASTRQALKPALSPPIRAFRPLNSQLSRRFEPSRPGSLHKRQLLLQRNASTAATDIKSAGTRAKNFVYGTFLLLGLGFGYLYITDTRAGFHQWLVVPTLRLLCPDAEDAHHAGTSWLKALYNFRLHPRERGDRDGQLGDLKVEIFGHVLDNPIGTSAGIDKNGDVSSPLFALGPAVVEVGGVTAVPQEGNPKPRVFRIPSQNALINRYGLNSLGADNVAARLRQRVREFAYSLGLGLGRDGEDAVLNGEVGVPPGSLIPGKLLLVQCAKNKATPDGDIQAIAKDYEYCVDRLAPYADVLVVNVSSPNTPGLRNLQAAGPLTTILTSVVNAARRTDRKTKPAVMVKVSPDEDSTEQVDGICAAVWASGVDGVIVGNTTNKRPDPIPKGFIIPEKDEKTLTEVGGYSGPQMFERTLALVKKYRSRLDDGPPEESKASAEPTSPKNEATTESKDAGVQRDLQRLKPQTLEAVKASKQPLLQLPERQSLPESAPAPTASLGPITAPPHVDSASSDQKVIFATGGITNGKQCLQILNAGASVCQVYTAMMYGGVGTITRMKREMREEIAKNRK
ncbi:FMN-linked oxidoreductase [Polychaeton citri CBS 116435]|uniref:Dihydroorotate dehydrogenase (quinone), mitochondrial n=1 Tax=Polychaeton citri CBS 116435 TaxID=1314669 RepID=A0A9P4UT98_9PEZI|nr:FMN-linked oxidoreductase [Polychaeton citri CBS 116435]